MNPVFFLILAFSALGLLIAGVWSLLVPPKQNPVQARVQAWITWEKYNQISDEPRVRRRRRANTGLYGRFPALLALDRTLDQVNSRFTAWGFILFIVILFGASFALVRFFTQDAIKGATAAIAISSAPCLMLWRKKQQYLRAFEKQLPDALDMLARSLWAGHTLQTGMRIVGEDFEPPIGREFKKTFESIDFGVNIPVALEDMAQRVDCPELRYFVTSVMVQREAGGNLAEILARTANLIHSRLEFNDRIKALSAQGRFSAQILFFLPLFLAGVIYWKTPTHFDVLFESTTGIMILIVTGALMLIGYFVIRAMVNIKI
ncbi:MAG: hypothetical protein ETSY2_15470 [Candidatus Entotheonella gemina]|uniref:Type II secretion system protein GspF domain-containing protein n=2 Tax=Candidatus Entotheonella TaxID=93171 RepID=W4M8M8_9BACT|nr:MAG: hypothetical protein ETSY2_15470 [Candidatus Entotheonella gemina]